MIQRSIVILVAFGYLAPVVGNPLPQPAKDPAHILYEAYKAPNRKLVETLLTQGDGSPVEQLEKTLIYALKKNNDPNKPYDNAAVAARIQNDLIESQKSWFQRHYRLTTIGIPSLAFLVVGFTTSCIVYGLNKRG